MKAKEFVEMVKREEAAGNYLVTLRRDWDAIEQVRADDWDENAVLWDRNGKCGTFKADEWKRYVKFVSREELERKARR